MERERQGASGGALGRAAALRSRGGPIVKKGEPGVAQCGASPHPWPSHPPRLTHADWRDQAPVDEGAPRAAKLRPWRPGGAPTADFPPPPWRRRRPPRSLSYALHLHPLSPGPLLGPVRRSPQAYVDRPVRGAAPEALGESRICRSCEGSLPISAPAFGRAVAAQGGGSVTPLYFFWETQRRILRVRGG